ncbi:DUF1800 family protein [Porticoccaceae bacterium]|nr:DUF1800 family protein [Porticoccaceae bacterium]
MKSSIAILATTILLIGCGGGGDSSSSAPATPVQPIVVGLSVVTAQAVESNNQIGKFKIVRTGPSNAISVAYELSDNADITKSTASASDYQLTYSDGGDVGAYFELDANQNSRVIEVRPVADAINEVPEALNISLVDASSYNLSSDQTGSVSIVDAPNDSENRRIFLGNFTPQANAVTDGSGVLSFILQGDNDSGRLSYSYANLGSVQTDQHVHLAPSGVKVKEIESSGFLSSYVWDLAPGGIFVNEQQMLDALFNGEFFVNIHTANYPGGEIFATLVYDATVEAPEETPLTAEQVDQDILRFLTQSTFGPTPNAYEQLRGQIDAEGDNRLQVYSDWIEQQFDIPKTSMLSLVDATIPVFEGENKPNIREDSFLPIALYGRDQLRQRVAFALSEILVVSDQNATVNNAYRGLSDYWDMLADNAFGTYRQTLEEVTLHPIMGVYLSHLRNQKADPDSGYYPDENYAREVMQLFTFGLLQRQQNGAVILAADSLPVPTYDNNVIKQMAKVFTGLSFSRSANDGVSVENNNFNKGTGTNEYQFRWTAPMKFFPDYHDFGQKTLFSDNGQALIIAANPTMDSATAEAELGTVLDALVSHSSTAPFIARKLIQRFVTSNPSQSYIERVANAFGEAGDLKAVMRAILLDVEARNPSVSSSITFGKLKEPVLQLTAILRLLEAASEVPLGESEVEGIEGLNYVHAEQFDAGVSLMRTRIAQIGQVALAAPSVFNFFSPDFAPTGEIASNSLVSPELQLVTESQLFSTFNTYHQIINGDFVRYNQYTREHPNFSIDQLKVRLNYSGLQAVWNDSAGDETAKATALVDYLDLYLNAGQLAETQNTGTRSVMISNLAVASEEERYKLAVYAVSTTPEFLIQR